MLNISKGKRLPIRMCVSCRKRKLKFDLLRIAQVKRAAKASENFEGANDGSRSVFVDEAGKNFGRGLYLCNSLECFEKFKKSKKLCRNFSPTTTLRICSELERILGSDV